METVSLCLIMQVYQHKHGFCFLPAIQVMTAVIAGATGICGRMHRMENTIMLLLVTPAAGTDTAGLFPLLPDF